jgi:hypothetical protein
MVKKKSPESLDQRFPEAEAFPLRMLDDSDGADSVDLIFRHHDLPAKSRDRFDLPARQ